MDSYLICRVISTENYSHGRYKVEIIKIVGIENIPCYSVGDIVGTDYPMSNAEIVSYGKKYSITRKQYI